MDYRPDIDGLRALAVVPVVLFHAGFSAFSGGFVGVDVFFVISGFLITSIILADQSAGTFTVRGFYERRARRILPALFVVLAVTLLAAWVWMNPLEQRNLARSLQRTLLFVSNYHFARETGYFAPDADQWPLLHTWSLAVEEQYYLLFPLLMLVLLRAGRRWLLVALVMLGLASLIHAELSSRASVESVFYDTRARVWELAVGAVLAVTGAVRLGRALPPVARQALAMAGLLMVCAAVVAYDRATPFPGLHALLPTLGAALLIVWATPETWAGRFLGLRPMVFVGLISYSAYLWHQPLLVFARNLGGHTQSAAWATGAVVLAFGFAWLTWRWVERPFRDRSRISRAVVFAGSALAAAALALAAWALLAKAQGVLRQFEPARSDAAQQQDQCFLLSKDITFQTYDRHDCYPADASRPAVLLIGDSHAASLYPALAEYFRDKPYTFSQMTAAYCLPLVTRFPANASKTANRRCEQINQHVLDRIRQAPPALVILSAYHYEWGYRSGGNDWSYPGYRADFQAALSRLVATGAKVAVVGQFVVWDPHLPIVLALEARRNAGRVADIGDAGLVRPAFAADADMKALVQHAGAAYWPVMDRLCTTGGCRRMTPPDQGGSAISFDYGHLSRDGGRYLVTSVLASDLTRSLQK